MSRRCRRCCRCGRLRWWCAGGTNSHSSSIFPPCSGGRASCANAFAQGRAHGVSTATCVSLCYAEWYRPKRKRASKTITLSPYVRWRFIASVIAYRRGQRLLHCRDTTCPNYGTTSNIIIIDAVGLMAVTHRGVVIPEHAALIMVGIYITKTHTDRDMAGFNRRRTNTTQMPPYDMMHTKRVQKRHKRPPNRRERCSVCFWFDDAID